MLLRYSLINKIVEYGLWRIKVEEDDYFRKRRNKNKSLNKFLFFTKKGGH